ncbi:MAG: hypothetical protein AAFQ51_00135 [Pseudomonadota bacterium]
MRAFTKSKIWVLRLSLRFPVLAPLLIPGLLAVWAVVVITFGAVVLLSAQGLVRAAWTAYPTATNIVLSSIAVGIFAGIVPPTLGWLWTAAMIFVGRRKGAKRLLDDLTRRLDP